jgi:hypothetical protein
MRAQSCGCRGEPEVFVTHKLYEGLTRLRKLCMRQYRRLYRRQCSDQYSRQYSRQTVRLVVLYCTVDSLGSLAVQQTDWAPLPGSTHSLLRGLPDGSMLI